MNTTVYKSAEGKKLIIESYRRILGQWPVPHENIDINTRYGRTFVIASGNESMQPLILLHGSSTNSAMWMGDIGILSKNHRVYAVDIIGEPGLSNEIRPPLNPRDYSDWIEDIMEKLSISKASFIGNSLGTWISLGFATNHPGKVSKLVLLAAAGIGPFKRSFIWKVILYSMFGPKNPDRINKLVYGDLKMPDEVLEFGRLIYDNYNPRMNLKYIFSDEELQKLTMPVLYIAGAKDNLIDTAGTVERLKGIPGEVIIQVRPDSGHAIINCAEQIAEFLG